MRWAVGGAAALLIGAGVWALARGLLDRARQQAIEETVAMLPGVSQHVRDFRRVKMEDGRKVWEIVAAEGRLYGDDDLIVVTQPAVEWTTRDGDVIGLRGREGRITLRAKDLAEVEVVGDIEVRLDGYRVRTENARYRHETRRIVTDAAVVVEGDRLELRGDGLEVDLAGEVMRLHHNVSMRFEPESGAPPG